MSYKEPSFSPKLAEIADLVDDIVEQKFFKYGIDKGSPKQIGAQVRAQLQKSISQDRKLMRKEVQNFLNAFTKSLNVHGLSSSNSYTYEPFKLNST